MQLWVKEEQNIDNLLQFKEMRTKLTIIHNKKHIQ